MNSDYEFLEFYKEPAVLLNSNGSIAAYNKAFRVLCSAPEELLGIELPSLLNCPRISAAEAIRRAAFATGDCLLADRPIREIKKTKFGVFELFVFDLFIESERAATVEEDLVLLSGTLVHDLNNILTGILGHVSFLSMIEGSTPEQRGSLDAIEKGTRRAADLAQQILQVAETSQLELESVNLCAIAQEAVDIIGKKATAAGVSLEVLGLEVAQFLEGDSRQLSQLILNLLVNAIDASSESARVELKVESVTRENLSCSEEQKPRGDTFVCLSVRDFGQGIPREIQESIFEPFFTTKGTDGNGLGLAAVQAIVNSHGGTLTLNSEPGQGAEFLIVIAACPIRADSSEVSEPALPGSGLGSERILAVDDEDSIRLVVERGLNHLGYSVSTAANGEEAITKFREANGAFSLVILDMIMPGMPGDDLFFELKKINPEVPVLIASGYASQHRTRAILENGGLGYIQKPFSIEELAAEVRRCIDISLQ